jgi:hypothetical protein
MQILSEMKIFLFTNFLRTKLHIKESTMILLLLLVFNPGSAQDNSFTRNSFFTAGYSQINEGANLGLVFTGPEINYGMTWNIKNEKRLITIGYESGVGIEFSKNIPALSFYIKPAETAYMFRIPDLKNSLYIGPSLKFEYDYSLYPQLQSGFDYWFTNFSFGLKAQYDFRYRSSSFHIAANSSLAGFISRQPVNRDPYFFDLGLKYAIRNLHQDLSVGSLNKFNTTNLEVLWKPVPDSRLLIGYSFRYSRYYQSPELIIVSHSIKILINKKNN